MRFSRGHGRSLFGHGRSLRCLEVETIRYPVSEVAAKYGASVAKETGDPDEAYADWPGEYAPTRLAWPLEPR
jgi:hypothetical protein